MKKFFSDIPAAFRFSSYASAFLSAPEYRNVPAAERVPEPSIPLIRLSSFSEQYSWLFLPGLIAASVVVVLVINIIKARRNL